MSDLIVSVSGMRGVVGETLTLEVIERFVQAASLVMQPGDMVVSRDGRANGVALADHVCQTLCQLGRNVIFADITSTPTTGVLIRQMKAAGGIQVSASHNPVQYNGLKLFDASGRFLTASRGDQLRQQFLDSQQPETGAKHPGQRILHEDTLQRHLELVLATVNVERIR